MPVGDAVAMIHATPPEIWNIRKRRHGGSGRETIPF
jgi:hypothetical protein